jgi:plastocyanin
MVAMKALLAGAALAAISHAANIQVQVAKSGLSFTPNSFPANVGDTVSFVFNAGHSVVEAAFASPCQPLANGFAVPVQTTTGATFTVNITDTSPRWFYCSVSTILDY